MDSKISTLEKDLWNSGFDVNQAYNSLLLEQYKIYIEMADRISQRRMLANTFFLTLNTSIIAIIITVSSGFDSIQNIIIVSTSVISCIVWAALLRSYRTLNTAKFEVIGAMEKKLPCSPFYNAEWKSLKYGENKGVHIPFGAIEKLVPFLFIMLYTLFLITKI